MDIKKEFETIMKDQAQIALATSVNDIPNVRITNFFYCGDSKALFFGSAKNSKKIEEFASNSHVAFTTVPKNESKYVRSHGTVRKSEKTVYDVKESFVAKNPKMEFIIDNFGANLDLFEIPLSEVTVTLENQEVHELKL